MGVIRKAPLEGMLKRLSLDDDPSARRPQDRRTIYESGLREPLSPRACDGRI